MICPALLCICALVSARVFVRACMAALLLSDRPLLGRHKLCSRDLEAFDVEILGQSIGENRLQRAWSQTSTQQRNLEVDVTCKESEGKE